MPTLPFDNYGGIQLSYIARRQQLWEEAIALMESGRWQINQYVDWAIKYQTDGIFTDMISDINTYIMNSYNVFLNNVSGDQWQIKPL